MDKSILPKQSKNSKSLWERIFDASPGAHSTKSIKPKPSSEKKELTERPRQKGVSSYIRNKKKVYKGLDEADDI